MLWDMAFNLLRIWIRPNGTTYDILKWIVHDSHDPRTMQSDLKPGAKTVEAWQSLARPEHVVVLPQGNECGWLFHPFPGGYTQLAFLNAALAALDTQGRQKGRPQLRFPWPGGKTLWMMRSQSILGEDFRTPGTGYRCYGETSRGKSYIWRSKSMGFLSTFCSVPIDFRRCYRSLHTRQSSACSSDFIASAHGGWGRAQRGQRSAAGGYNVLMVVVSELLAGRMLMMWCW